MDDETRIRWRVEREAVLGQFDDVSLRRELVEVLKEYQYNGLDRAKPFLPRELTHSSEVFWEVIRQGFQQATREQLKRLFDVCFEPMIFLVPHYSGATLIDRINRNKPESQIGFFGNVHAPGIVPHVTTAQAKVQVVVTDGASPSALLPHRLDDDHNIRLAFDKRYIQIGNVALDIADPATVLLIMHNCLQQEPLTDILSRREKTIVELYDDKNTLAEAYFLSAQQLHICISKLPTDARVPSHSFVRPQLVLGSVVMESE